MSTIPSNFFPGAVPARPAATAGISADDARPICPECIAHAQCVFAEHLKKGIFIEKYLRVADDIVSHQRAMTMWKWSDNRRFGIHEPPTIGSRIRRRTSRFAQKLRKLFPPRDRHRGRSQCVGRRCRTSCSDMCRARLAPLRMARTVDRNVATGKAMAAIPGTRMSPRTTPFREYGCADCRRRNDDAGAEQPAGIVLLLQ